MVITIQGTTFQVDYDYQPKEAETQTYPGCPEEVIINSVKVYGSSIDIHEFMSGYWLGRIEEEILEQQ